MWMASKYPASKFKKHIFKVVFFDVEPSHLKSRRMNGVKMYENEVIRSDNCFTLQLLTTRKGTDLSQSQHVQTQCQSKLSYAYELVIINWIKQLSTNCGWSVHIEYQVFRQYSAPEHGCIPFIKFNRIPSNYTSTTVLHAFIKKSWEHL